MHVADGLTPRSGGGSGGAKKPPTRVATGGFGDEEYWRPVVSDEFARRASHDRQRQRLVLRLHDGDGLSVAEIAGLLGVTPARVALILDERDLEDT
jgi:DNA-directed RNA polymerase specialized sigma24 family protein